MTLHARRFSTTGRGTLPRPTSVGRRQGCMMRFCLTSNACIGGTGRILSGMRGAVDRRMPWVMAVCHYGGRHE
ncbi:hypothetical protein PCLA_06f0128 [Pseudomonas citronellolis]|nr:hypothetical protein PCLA_06f0128 [Pseudomonas citronellolis]